MEVEKDWVKVEFLKDISIKELNIKRDSGTDEQFNEIGTKVVENVFKRVYMRRWSQSSEKMVFFESDMFIGIPKWVSYKDAHVFFDEFMQKLKRSTNNTNNNNNKPS